MSEHQPDTIWRRYAMWWGNSKFLAPFMFAWMVSTFVGLFVPAQTLGTFLVICAITFLSLVLMDRAVRKELKLIHTELQDSGAFDELKSTIMAAAADMAKKSEGRDPDRLLRAVCHNCDNDIYSDDKMYTNGKQHCFCDVCWDLGSAKE